MISSKTSCVKVHCLLFNPKNKLPAGDLPQNSFLTLPSYWRLCSVIISVFAGRWWTVTSNILDPERAQTRPSHRIATATAASDESMIVHICLIISLAPLSATDTTTTAPSFGVFINRKQRRRWRRRISLGSEPAYAGVSALAYYWQTTYDTTTTERWRWIERTSSEDDSVGGQQA